LIDEPLMLDVKDGFDKPAKCGVDMGKAEPRFVEKLPKDPFYKEYNIEDLPEF
jgi:hypothetical protein